MSYRFLTMVSVCVVGATCFGGLVSASSTAPLNTIRLVQDKKLQKIVEAIRLKERKALQKKDLNGYLSQRMASPGEARPSQKEFLQAVPFLLAVASPDLSKQHFFGFVKRGNVAFAIYERDDINVGDRKQIEIDGWTFVKTSKGWLEGANSYSSSDFKPKPATAMAMKKLTDKLIRDIFNEWKADGKK